MFCWGFLGPWSSLAAPAGPGGAQGHLVGSEARSGLWLCAPGLASRSPSAVVGPVVLVRVHISLSYFFFPAWLGRL